MDPRLRTDGDSRAAIPGPLLQSLALRGNLRGIRRGKLGTRRERVQARAMHRPRSPRDSPLEQLPRSPRRAHSRRKSYTSRTRARITLSGDDAAGLVSLDFLRCKM